MSGTKHFHWVPLCGTRTIHASFHKFHNVSIYVKPKKLVMGLKVMFKLNCHIDTKRENGERKAQDLLSKWDNNKAFFYIQTNSLYKHIHVGRVPNFPC